MNRMRHERLLIDSYERLTGKRMLADEGGSADGDGGTAERLFEAPFVLLSHGTEEDPVLNYGNRAALELWEMTREEFTSLPSRLTAEPIERSLREKLLRDSKERGYSDGYYGVRIAKSGRRFEIRDVTLWSLIDENGIYRGQAAMFSDWRYL